MARHRSGETVYASSGRNSSREGQGSTQGAPPPSVAAPAAARQRLQHPSSQHEVQGALQPQERPLEPQAQRVVSVLLRELDAARQQSSAAQAELAAVKSELLQSLRQRCKPQGGGGSSEEETGRRKPEAAGSGPIRIKAFRPAGLAPPPKALHQPGRQHPACAAGAPSAATRSSRGSPQQRQQQQQGEVVGLRQENSEMRAHLETLHAHCGRLQRELEAAASAQPRRAASPPAAGGRQAPPPVAGLAAAVQEQDLGSPRRRPRSPGHTTLVISSPQADGADLAVAVFQPAPEEAGEVRLALTRLQRQHLKLSSKLAKCQSELADRAAEARRWQEGVEQQAGDISELRVEAEAGRRQQRGLEQALVAAQGEQAAAQADVAALLGQLRAAEGAANAAEGEAAALGGRLAVAEEQLERALREVERLKEEAASTAARLGATDLVRREAERECDELRLQGQRLRAALAEAQASGGAVEEDLAAQLSAAQQAVAVEQQRNAMLQAQLSLVEAQGRERERILTEQLCAVQEERSACLAAATRADALLVKLGQHAMTTRGADS